MTDPISMADATSLPYSPAPSQTNDVMSVSLRARLARWWNGLFQAPFFVDINRDYADVMQFARVDLLTHRLLWIHAGLLTALVLANTTLHLAAFLPSPFGWRSLSTVEGLMLIAIGLAAAALPDFVYRRANNHYLWRLTTAVCLTTFSFLLIYASGGAIEMHFHFFLVMAYMAIYADWRIGWFIFGLIAIHNLLLDALAPGWFSFYGRNDLAVPLHAMFTLAMAVFVTLLCRNYRGAMVELVSAKQRNDQFLAIASHELKTPLTSMKGYTEVLQRRLRRTSDSGSLEYAEKLDDQLNKITNLVRDLLDVSRIQYGQVDLQKELISAETLVHQAIEDVQALTNRHTIELEGQTRVLLLGDRLRLGQVLINLLSNAIKYSPDADKVVVRVAATRDKAVVSVQDSGMGIPVSDQERLFEPYFRGRDTRREDVPGGLGMGLYICREIIRHHHGKIWVESEEGKGSTISFSLPLPRPEELH